MDRRSGTTSQLCTAATTLTERQERQDQGRRKTDCQRVMRRLTGWLLDGDGRRIIIGVGGPRWSRAGWHCTGPTPASIMIVVLMCGTQHSSVSVHDSRNRLRLMKPGRGSRPACSRAVVVRPAARAVGGSCGQKRVRGRTAHSMNRAWTCAGTTV